MGDLAAAGRAWQPCPIPYPLAAVHPGRWNVLLDWEGQVFMVASSPWHKCDMSESRGLQER